MKRAGRSRLRGLVAAFLPGALAGTQIAGLLFFLNPHLPFDTVPVLRGVAFFSSLVGSLSLLILGPFLWRRPEQVERWIPWCLTLVLAGAAIGAWIHASYYAFYLPAGINRRLVKAGIWLSLTAVVCFYTALIHQVRQRPYGRRSQVLFTVVALASIYVVFERREAFKPEIGPGPRATTFEGNPRPQLLVVGIEAATLDAILPLAEQGRLPFFNKILNDGSYARLGSLGPVRRQPLWMTLATGTYPFQHGILSEEIFRTRFLDPQQDLKLLPVGLGFKYWGTWSREHSAHFRDRRVLTLWEILSRLEISSALVGWPLVGLAAEDDGSQGVEVGLSDELFQAPIISEEALRNGWVWPTEMVERARLFHTSATGLDQDQTLRFGPDPPSVVLESLSQDVWREDLTVFLLEPDRQKDAYFLVLPGLYRVSRRYFGGYSAQFEGEQDTESVIAAQLISAYYAHLDEFLSRLWEKSREPRLMAVVSVHGVEDSYGLRKISQLLRRQPPLSGHVRRAPDGILMLLGEGIRAGSRISSAELVDLVPSLLYGLGFPIARDLDGAVLTDAFENAFLARQPLTFLPSYQTFAAPEE